MPIKIQDNLPAKEILKSENIFVMDDARAFHQDIRPLKIAILNLMPLKQVTEVQLLRLLGNSPLQIDIKLVNMKSHQSKNTSIDYLENFYNNFSDIKNERFDGLVITGAPVEKLNFGEVTYWDELTDIMEWSKHNVTSTLHICWGAQAGLNYHYGISKHDLPQKLFGVFAHTRAGDYVNLLRGFDDVFYAPHSRHTEIRREDILCNSELMILSESEQAGVYIIATKDGKQIFVTGHSEYDFDTLKKEYFRDKEKGLDIQVPINYFKNDDPNYAEAPLNIWRGHANLLFSNWLNYYVYQETPYIL